MKNEIIKELGDIVGSLAKGTGGNSSMENKNSGDRAENNTDSIIDTLVGKLGGGTQRQGQAGRRQGGGRGSGAGGCGGSGGGRSGGGRRCA
jgi:hypothetical protein